MSVPHVLVLDAPAGRSGGLTGGLASPVQSVCSVEEPELRQPGRAEPCLGQAGIATRGAQAPDAAVTVLPEVP